MYEKILLMAMLNSVGPRMDLCGTPFSICRNVDVTLLYLTYATRLLKKFCMKASILPLIFHPDSASMIFCFQTVSNAFCKSNETASRCRCCEKDSAMVFCRDTRWSVVDLFDQDLSIHSFLGTRPNLL